MNQLMNNVQSSVNIAVLVDNKFIGGQLGASLSRSASAIDITNKINGEWQNNLSGVKTWQITCNGLYIKDATGFSALEDAFMNNNSIKVQMTIGDTKWIGNALVVDFPLSAVYNQQFKYSIKLLGDGELTRG